MREEKAYSYWMGNIPGIGDQTAKLLIKQFGTAKEVFFAEKKGLQEFLSEQKLQLLIDSKKQETVFQSYERVKRQGIEIVSFFEKAYPQRLQSVKEAPYLLYYKGKLPEDNKPALAIIGARECSGYGEYAAEAFARRIAEAGVNIISGMARGIDGISQNAAVEAKGASYGVLGCGVDICYPTSNRKLYEKIQERGGILSAYPPGTQPKKHLFPARNRIVAGLSDMLLVVEARQKSGTWITVDMALEQGKNVYAIPGRITDRLSDGCNMLLRQGAGIALSPEDILAEFQILINRRNFLKKTGNTDKAKEKKESKREEPKQEGLLAYLDFYPKSADEIFEQVKQEDKDMALPRLMFELVQLCLEGKAEQLQGNFYLRR